MRYLQKLPLLLALAAALITGLVGFARHNAQKDILIHMVLVMVLFFVLGLYSRFTLTNINNQIEKKKKEKEQEELKKQQELEQQAKEKEMGLGRNIDFTAGETDEDAFDPLPVSEFIQKELKSG
jgi:uncharacterized membrane protein YuzA (DUF378 family)